LILSDVMMPNLDGFQFLAAIRGDERTKRIPLILLSARAGEESRVEGLDAGADDYMIKPFSARELLARVNARLEIARLQNELAQSLDGEVRARTEQLEQRTAELSKQAHDIRDLSTQLLRAQDDERRHVARELHDSAGQTLAVLAMSLNELVQEVSTQAPELAKRAEATQELVQQLQKEIRTASYLLHPPMLDECGLPSALSLFASGVRERTGILIELSVGVDVGRVPREMELAVFRLVQECLTNVHRHSHSKSAQIRLRRENDMLRLEVQDHGRGITAKRLAEIQAGGSGVGIRGMRERVHQLNGNMNVTSSRSGTVVAVDLPITEPVTES